MAKCHRFNLAASNVVLLLAKGVFYPTSFRTALPTGEYIANRNMRDMACIAHNILFNQQFTILIYLFKAKMSFNIYYIL